LKARNTLISKGWERNPNQEKLYEFWSKIPIISTIKFQNLGGSLMANKLPPI